MDAKAVLLVDDRERKIVEFDLVLEQRMGADDDVDVAAGQSRAHFRRLLGGDHAGQLRHPQRQAGETGGEGAGMLPGEALDDLLAQARALDMDQVRATLAARERDEA